MIGERARGRSCRRRRRQGSKNIKRKEELYMNHVVSWSEGRKRRHRRRKKKRNRMLKSRHIRIAFLSEAFLFSAAAASALDSGSLGVYQLHL